LREVLEEKWERNAEAGEKAPEDTLEGDGGPSSENTEGDLCAWWENSGCLEAAGGVYSSSLPITPKELIPEMSLLAASPPVMPRLPP
jgi:hypothetical protein